MDTFSSLNRSWPLVAFPLTLNSPIKAYISHNTETTYTNAVVLPGTGPLPSLYTVMCLDRRTLQEMEVNYQSFIDCH